MYRPRIPSEARMHPLEKKIAVIKSVNPATTRSGAISFHTKCAVPNPNDMIEIVHAQPEHKLQRHRAVIEQRFPREL